MTKRLAGLLLALGLASLTPRALAQSPGGLYIAGNGFTFVDAVKQALADNRKSGRFFVLVLPPQTRSLAAKGIPRTDANLRRRAKTRGAQFLVCRRDVQNGAVVMKNLVPGVGVIWGWTKDPNAPQIGTDGLFPGESPAHFPAADELVRRMRSVCAS